MARFVHDNPSDWMFGAGLVKAVNDAQLRSVGRDLEDGTNPVVAALKGRSVYEAIVPILKRTTRICHGPVGKTKGPNLLVKQMGSRVDKDDAAETGKIPNDPLRSSHG